MTSNYEIVKVVGEGSYGKALLAKRRSDNLQCILKQINITKLSRQEAMFTKQEASLLSKLNHPNIVTFIESFTTPNSVYIVMEFADRGDLSKLIRDQRGRFFHENIVTDVFLQMSLGLKHIHDRKILHRDLKTANIFLTRSGQVKIGDFGVSRVLRNTAELAKTVIGTPLYMSPEILDNKNYNSKSDIWSMGCILYELMCLRLPFNGKSMPELCRNIMLSSYVQPPSHYSTEIRQLLKELLSKAPRERPGINSVLCKPILKSQISKHLKEAEVNEEFSHTLIHGGDILRGNIDKLVAENYNKKNAVKVKSNGDRDQDAVAAAAPEHKVVVDNLLHVPSKTPPIPSKPPPKVLLQAELKPPPPPQQQQQRDVPRHAPPENRPIGEAAAKRPGSRERKVRDRPWAQPMQPRLARRAPLESAPALSKAEAAAARAAPAAKAAPAAAVKPSLFLRRAELREGGKFGGGAEVDPSADKPIPDGPDSSDDDAPNPNPSPNPDPAEKARGAAVTPSPPEALRNNWLSQLEMRMGDLRGQLQGLKIKSPPLAAINSPSPLMAAPAGANKAAAASPKVLLVPQALSDKKAAPVSRTPLSVARAAAAAKLTPKDNHLAKRPVPSAAAKRAANLEQGSVSEPSPKEALAARKQRRDDEREALRDFLRQQRREAFPLQAGDQGSASACTPPACSDKELVSLAPSAGKSKISRGLPSPGRLPTGKKKATPSPAAAAAPTKKKSVEELKADRDEKREELRRLIAERKRQTLASAAPIEILYGPAGEKYIATSSTDAPVDDEVETAVYNDLEGEGASTVAGRAATGGSTLSSDMDAEARAGSCCALLSQCFSSKAADASANRAGAVSVERERPLLGATMSTSDKDYSILLSQLQEIMSLPSKQPSSDELTAAKSVPSSSQGLYDNEDFEEEEVDINALVGEEFEADFTAEVDDIAFSGGDLSDDAQDEVFEFSELSLDDSADESDDGKGGPQERSGGDGGNNEEGGGGEDGVVEVIDQDAEVDAMTDFSDDIEDAVPAPDRAKEAPISAPISKEAARLWGFLAPRVGEARLREATSFLSSLGDEDDRDEEYLTELESIVGSACIKYLDLMFQLTMALAERP